jgi:transcription initiation factor TFIID subunit 7
MEDHFILRAPPALAARLRRVLAEDASADAASLELVFSEDGRTGHLRVGADIFPAKLMDLPTKVESWKSLDDVNLVKSADIGQIIVVSPPGSALPTADVSVNGVTVALRCASQPAVPRGAQGRLVRRSVASAHTHPPVAL